jgi:hypothetical protein
MNSIELGLIEHARTVAEAMSAGTAANDLREIEQRLQSYRPCEGDDYLCPYCEVRHGQRAVVTPMGGGTNTHDFMRCRACESIFPLRTPGLPVASEPDEDDTRNETTGY